MPYKEAARVPLIVSWKGVTSPGRVDKTHLVSTGLELIPTLCDFAGIAIPSELHGASVKRLTLEESNPTNWQDCVVAENERSRILWTEQFMYAVYDRGTPREFLVDLQNDPGEMHNLAIDGKYREILAKHRALLKQWYKGNGETLDAKYIVSAAD
jgi:arylsulfatase A-like enzyme